MKMVKTFMKTQHQHVMPPEKGRKERKGKETHTANQPGKRAARPRAGPPTTSEDKVRGGRPASGTKHNTTPHRPAFLRSLPENSKGSSPVTSPHPQPQGGEEKKERPNTTGKTMDGVCYKCSSMGRYRGKSQPPPRSTMPVPPLTYVHRGRRAALAGSRKQTREHGLEKDQGAHL